MDQTTIEKFNPTKAELLSLAEECRNLEIKGIDDEAGYKLVHEHRIKLKNARVTIEKTGKAAREEAVAYQRAVIAHEKELIGIIEPLERALQAKQKEIDELREQEKRRALLPERHERLREVLEAGSQVTDEHLLTLSEDQFEVYFNELKAAFLSREEARIKAEQEERERKIREEEQRVAAEKQKLEDEKLAEQRRKEAEAEEARRKEAEARRIEEERKAAAERAVQEERERVEREKREAEEAEAKRIAAEKEEQEKLERRKKYQNFLDKHGYKDDGTFQIEKRGIAGEKQGYTVTLWKKVGEIKL